MSINHYLSHYRQKYQIDSQFQSTQLSGGMTVESLPSSSTFNKKEIEDIFGAPTGNVSIFYSDLSDTFSFAEFLAKGREYYAKKGLTQPQQSSTLAVILLASSMIDEVVLSIPNKKYSITQGGTWSHNGNKYIPLINVVSIFTSQL